jgi:hypothetical protein
VSAQVSRLTRAAGGLDSIIRRPYACTVALGARYRMICAPGARTLFSERPLIFGDRRACEQSGTTSALTLSSRGTDPDWL